MKKIMIAMLVLLASNAWAQTFEGTIKWSMKMEANDPAMRAKMAQGQQDAQQKMNDPATQAKMKDLQEKMKDPKIKAAMEANPQMKAMMEKMTQGNAGDMAKSMMPSGFTVKLKDGNSLVTVEGGMMSGDMLTTKEKTVHLDRQNKTYAVMPAGNGPGAAGDGAKPTVTKTSETTKILGYNCTKYIVAMSDHGQTITSNVWATTEIKDIDVKAMAKQKMGRGQSIFYEGVDGMPLRIESITKEANVTIEITDIKRESLNAADFTIPSDYTESKGMGMFGK